MRASERAEAWLRTIKQELVVMIIAAISCAFVQGLSRLSTEKYPPLTSYHDVLTTVVSQALWGMPFLAVIQLLEAVASRVILEGKRCSGFDSEADKADGDRRAKGDS
jgi:hypothetical protein